VPREQRRLAAIMSADVVGYSRLMGRSESATLARLKAVRADVVDPAISEHGGRIVKTTGDGLLAEFPSAVDAVNCGVAIQKTIDGHGSDPADDDRLQYRIGIHVGDIIIDAGDIFGDGVNIAARIEALAAPGGVAISDAVIQHVRGRIDVAFVDRGSHEVKNIEHPLRVFGWTPDGEPALPPEEPQLPDRPSIAVLPFDNMSGDPEQGYFADGITEDIITDLSKVSGLFVIARNSSFAYKGKSPDVRQVSRELGVRYVLEGSVRKAASRVRINAQMIDGETGGHLWAERYDRDLADIFEVQDEVTRTIVTALKVKLTEREQAQRETRAKVSPEVYDLIVRARQTAMQLRPEASVMARAMLERVVEIDPNVAIAYARLAIITFAEYVNRWNNATADNLSRARELAEKAIATDETEPQGHIAMAILSSWTRHLDEAERHAERAIELDVNSPDGYTGLGNVREFQGRPQEAVPLYTRAYRLDPQWDMALHFLGRSLLSLEHFDEAETAFKRRLTFSPHSDMTRFYLACLYGRTGRHEEARAMWQDLLRVNPGFSIDHLRQSLPYEDPKWFERNVDGLTQAGIAA
jgi:adenylate cyclase